MGGVALQITLTLSAATRWRMVESNGSMFGILQPGVSTRNVDRRRSTSSSRRSAVLWVPSTLSDRSRVSSTRDRMTADTTHKLIRVFNVISRRWSILDSRCYRRAQPSGHPHDFSDLLRRQFCAVNKLAMVRKCVNLGNRYFLVTLTSVSGRFASRSLASVCRPSFSFCPHASSFCMIPRPTKYSRGLWWSAVWNITTQNTASQLAVVYVILICISVILDSLAKQSLLCISYLLIRSSCVTSRMTDVHSLMH